MTRPDERFSVRIKQQTGAWAGVSYHPTKRLALETAQITDRDYIWAIFDGRKKVVDSRGWSGDVDFECGGSEAPSGETCVSDLQDLIAEVSNVREQLHDNWRVNRDNYDSETLARLAGERSAIHTMLIEVLVPMLSCWKEGQSTKNIRKKIYHMLNILAPCS